MSQFLNLYFYENIINYIIVRFISFAIWFSHTLTSLLLSSRNGEHRTRALRRRRERASGGRDTGAQVAPIVKLVEVSVTTGEEDEDPILHLCAKTCIANFLVFRIVTDFVFHYYAILMSFCFFPSRNLGKLSSIRK